MSYPFSGNNSLDFHTFYHPVSQWTVNIVTTDE